MSPFGANVFYKRFGLPKMTQNMCSYSVCIEKNVRSVACSINVSWILLMLFFRDVCAFVDSPCASSTDR